MLQCYDILTLPTFFQHKTYAEWLGIDYWSSHVKFVVDHVALEEFFLQVLRLSMLVSSH
jgi:hypothetical protein